MKKAFTPTHIVAVIKIRRDIIKQHEFLCELETALMQANSYSEVKEIETEIAQHREDISRCEQAIALLMQSR